MKVPPVNSRGKKAVCAVLAPSLQSKPSKNHDQRYSRTTLLLNKIKSLNANPDKSMSSMSQFYMFDFVIRTTVRMYFI